MPISCGLEIALLMDYKSSQIRAYYDFELARAQTIITHHMLSIDIMTTIIIAEAEHC